MSAAAETWREEFQVLDKVDGEHFGIFTSNVLLMINVHVPIPTM